MNLISVYIYISKRRKYLKIWYNHISEVFFMSDRHRKNNFYIDDLVKRLGDTIDTKINESNFSDLNETVKRSIDIALDQVNNSVIGQNLFGRNSYKKFYNKGYDPSNTVHAYAYIRYYFSSTRDEFYTILCNFWTNVWY